jgi:hypothetical protein
MIRQIKKLQLNTLLDYEYVQKKFKPLERLRNVEFTRDWGLPFTFQPVDENIIKVFAALKNGAGNSVAYQFVNYHRSDNYNGFPEFSSSNRQPGRLADEQPVYYYQFQYTE